MVKLFEQGAFNFLEILHIRQSSIFILFLLIFYAYHTVIVGLHRILSLLESEDADVRIHAVKVVANLAAEGIN